LAIKILQSSLETISSLVKPTRKLNLKGDYAAVFIFIFLFNMSDIFYFSWEKPFFTRVQNTIKLA
jgi:hypothetical protein